MLYSAQIRAARALLAWKQVTLADESNVTVATIKRVEKGSGPVRSSTDTAWRIQAALQKAGIAFIEGDEIQGPGVRLSKPADSGI